MVAYVALFLSESSSYINHSLSLNTPRQNKAITLERSRRTNNLDMESRAYVVLLTVLVVLATVADSQTICKVTIPGLMSCLPAAKPPNPPPPSQECCDALKDADLCCLYSHKDSPILPTLGVDPSLALQIPDKCHIAHPPHC